MSRNLALHVTNFMISIRTGLFEKIDMTIWSNIILYFEPKQILKMYLENVRVDRIEEIIGNNLNWNNG